ncbi:cancer-related nucleoside-triphosphatase homolog isoform X2 [Rhynchophorus ferrugineus]|uniref:cancer-related nucleoside-triphosphatase homolog isoform X2 n=1 Tax=Rhynchophorus ferrugineus TaxID=354439 RepID=UPI003FCCFCA3
MRHILITGVPGIGKTTLIQNIIKKLKDIDVELDGFYTQEYRNERNQRLGFEIVVIQNNKRGILADKSNAASTNDVRKLGQYTVYVKNFEELVFPIISTFVRILKLLQFQLKVPLLWRN